MQVRLKSIPKFPAYESIFKEFQLIHHVPKLGPTETLAGLFESWLHSLASGEDFSPARVELWQRIGAALRHIRGVVCQMTDGAHLDGLRVEQIAVSATSTMELGSMLDTYRDVQNAISNL